MNVIEIWLTDNPLNIWLRNKALIVKSYGGLVWVGMALVLEFLVFKVKAFGILGGSNAVSSLIKTLLAASMPNIDY